MKDLITIIEKLKVNSKTEINRQPGDWTIEDAINGDFVSLFHDMFFIYKCLRKDLPKNNNYLSKNSNYYDDTIIYHAFYCPKNKNTGKNKGIDIGPDTGVGTIKNQNSYHYKLATYKEKQDFIDTLKEIGYEWDEKNLELKKI